MNERLILYPPSNYVYMLRCADGTLYAGWTTDPGARERAHNEGRGAKYTRSRLPVRIVYVKECASKEAAMREEQYLKSLTRKEKLRLIAEREKIMTQERTTKEKPAFASDYTGTAHPVVLEALMKTAGESYSGYGLDVISEAAREKIRGACGARNAAVHFLAGGTQANRTVIDALLMQWQGVVAADTGHISVHEAGAIEAGGHKVLTLPHDLGKITAKQIGALCTAYDEDENHDHMVQPGMVYLSQPTEYGTLYSKKELRAIRRVCNAHGLRLYIDGARLAYALGSPLNDVSLKDLASLSDVFYIGGTKCGAMFGEAVVIPGPGLLPHFFTIVKQHGALLAKGWTAAVQFDALFTKDLYTRIGKEAVEKAMLLQDILTEKGYSLLFRSPTNQVFVTLENKALRRLEKKITMSFWEAADLNHTVVRLATSWSTTDADIGAVRKVM